MYVTQMPTFIKTLRSTTSIEVKSISKQHVWNLQAYRSRSLPGFRDTYPDFNTEHGGLREDGSPDQRVGTGGV
jgi:hypothetical protein